VEADNQRPGPVVQTSRACLGFWPTVLIRVHARDQIDEFRQNCLVNEAPRPTDELSSGTDSGDAVVLVDVEEGELTETVVPEKKLDILAYPYYLTEPMNGYR
jgi:hypothetical protein